MKTERSQLTKKIVFGALFIALVYLCTAFVNIRLPIAANGGLVHLGNVPLFIIALVFGKKYGALAGGVGMALFDITGGWLLWAPFTLAVVAYVVGAVTEKRKGLAAAIPALALACAIKILGYYIAEGRKLDSPPGLRAGKSGSDRGCGANRPASYLTHTFCRTENCHLTGIRLKSLSIVC